MSRRHPRKSGLTRRERRASRKLAPAPDAAPSGKTRETYLRAADVMKRFRVSRSTVYTGPLRSIAVTFGHSKGMRWPLSALVAFEDSRRGIRAPNGHLAPEDDRESHPPSPKASTSGCDQPPQGQ